MVRKRNLREIPDRQRQAEVISLLAGGLVRAIMNQPEPPENSPKLSEKALELSAGKLLSVSVVNAPR